MAELHRHVGEELGVLILDASILYGSQEFSA